MYTYCTCTVLYVGLILVRAELTGFASQSAKNLPVHVRRFPRACVGSRRARLGLDEGITAPATAGPHAHSNAACFARHRLAVVVRTVVVVSNRRGTRTTTFRKIIARHRAKRLERNVTNGQDRHATSFPLPPGLQEMPRDTRDEAGQRRGRLNSHCTQQSHCIQLSHRRRYRRPTPGEEEERKEAPLPYHSHVEEAKPLAIGEEGEASLSHLEAASVLLPKQTPATGEHEDLLRERRSNVEVAVSRPFFARDLAASSDEMHYPLDDAVGGLQGMPREFFQRLPVAFSR